MAEPDSGALPLRSHLRRAFTVLLGLVALAGVAGGAAIVSTRTTVERLTEVVLPAEEANTRLLQNGSDAQVGVRGYVITGNEDFLEPYIDSLELWPETAARLRRLTDGDPVLTPLIEAEIAAGEVWFDEWAVPLLQTARADRAAAVELTSTGGGRSRFGVFREAVAETRSALLTAEEAARSSISRTATIALSLFALLVVAGVVSTSVVATRTTAFVAGPLERLRRSLYRLSMGELDVRAEVEGPAETQVVAKAVNQLAQANQDLNEYQRGLLGAEVELRKKEQAAVSRLEELDTARADFVSSVSHELRTPLTSVTGYAEMLADGDAGPLSEDQLRMVAVIDRNARRLLALVEDLLTLSRVEAGLLRLEHAPVEVEGLLTDAVEAVEPNMAAKSIELLLDLEGTLGTVVGDRQHLDRVLLNLLSNSYKFTPENGRVVLSARRDDDALTISVTDSGIGIPEAEQPKMFERFFRSSTAREAVIPGTGLGLAIVKSIVEGHGGTIGFESTSGKGTTFTVVLPASAAEIETVPA